MKLTAEELKTLHDFVIPGDIEILGDFAQLAYDKYPSAADEVENGFENAKYDKNTSSLKPREMLNNAFLSLLTEYGDISIDREMLLRIIKKAKRQQAEQKTVELLARILHREFREFDGNP